MRAILNRAYWLRFSLLLLTALVPVLLYAVLAEPNATDLKQTAQRTANEFDRLIQLREREVFALATFASIRAFTASTPETRSQRAAVALSELQALVAADTNIRQALIADAGGIVIMTTDEGWNSDVSARKFVQDALHGQITVSPIARDSGENSTFYAAPVLNNRNDIVGALIIRVAAQEMWSVTPRGENFYAILSDENGVRLDDSGDPARRLASFGSLDTERMTRIVNEQTYGAELLQPRATNLSRAQQLVAAGAVDQLNAGDFDADAFAAQRLLSKPWYVLVLAPQPTFAELFSRLVIPIAAAIVFALGGTFVLMRL